MLKLKIALVTSALALAIASATIAFAGANLLKNGKFNNTNGWSPFDETTVLSIEARRLKVENTDASGTFTNAWASQCVGITPGAKYRFDVDALEPLGQPRDGSAFVDIAYFSEPGCNGSLAGSDTTDAAPAGEWTHFTLNLGAPAGAQSLRVDLVAAKGPVFEGQPADGTFHALFDNASLKTVGGKPQQ
ncbi:MAG: hypothetical protein ACRDHF_14700 [Tepidiformaceae bacterium]